MNNDTLSEAAPYPLSKYRGSSGEIFHTKHLGKSLKQNSIRGGTVTLAAQAARFVLRLLSSAILARLLTPEDYGLIAMTTVVSGLALVLRDGGLPFATIQREAITQRQVSLLFWVNVALGLVLASTLVAVSPLVVLMYDEPRLQPLVCALAIPILLGALAEQHRALLSRQMRFLTLSAIDIGSLFCSLAVGIAMAASHHGYWSLVAFEICNASLTVILLWLLLRWRPSLPSRSKSGIAMLRSGGNIMGFNLLNYFSRNADNALIGWFWGAMPLGLYSRAYSLLMLPMRNINAPFSVVAIPVLSRARNNPDTLRCYFLQGATIVAALVIPTVVCSAVFADDLVRLWLGERWIECARLFRLLSVPALLFGASQPISWLFIVLDRTRIMRNIGVVMAPVNIVAFCIGLPFGTEGVALGYAISSIMMFFPAARYALKGTGISVLDFFVTWRQPVIAACGDAATA